MYKEKKIFGLLALLLMGCGSMVAQSKPERGAEVKAAMGRMLMVAATAEQLTDIAQLEGVANIAIGTKPLLKLDKSRQVTHTDEVQSGTGEQLPQGGCRNGVHHQEWHSDRCQLPLPLPA